MKTGNDAWVELTEKVQYMMLGFHHDNEKLLFVEDYRKLKSCPINHNPDYFWKHIHLSKGFSFKLKDFTFLATSIHNGPTVNPKYVLRRAHRIRVKVFKITILHLKAFTFDKNDVCLLIFSVGLELI
jgi:hypothetical protein